MTQGKPESLEYCIFKYFGDARVSPWHDIPLYPGDGLLNFICEIPKATTAKMKLITHETGNPIRHDAKDGVLRYYRQQTSWNYGMLPQTWVDPDFIDPVVELGGDNDPTNVVDISSEYTCEIGGVYKVKPLGAYALLDNGEVDWKIIVINADDPKAPYLEDVDDIETEFPGELKKILEWLRNDKFPDSPSIVFDYNNTAFDGAFSREFANNTARRRLLQTDRLFYRDFSMQVVNRTNEQYNSLKSGARPNTVDLSLF